MEETRIRRQIDAIVELLQAKDLEGLRQVYASDVVSFDVEDAKPYRARLRPSTHHRATLSRGPSLVL